MVCPAARALPGAASTPSGWLCAASSVGGTFASCSSSMWFLAANGLAREVARVNIPVRRQMVRRRAMGDVQVRSAQSRAAGGSAPDKAAHPGLSLAARRAALASALIIAAAAVVALVVASPLAMNQLNSLWGLNWGRLSTIGQTYGAASALLTGLALFGVVGSMVFQARAIKVSREQSSREHLGHLIELALQDPVYQRCWGSDPLAGPTRDRYRQQVYLNLVMSHWEQDYVLGGFREHALRGAFAWLFRGEAGRTFWAETRDVRPQMSESRRARRFCRIAEEEYEKAIGSGPPSVLAQAQTSAIADGQRSTTRNAAMKIGSMVMVGLIGGIAVGKVLWSRSQ